MSLLIQSFEAVRPEGVYAVQYTKENGKDIVDWIAMYRNDHIYQEARIVGDVLQLRTEFNSDMFDFGILDKSEFPPTFDHIQYGDMIIFKSSTHYSWFIHSTSEAFQKKYLVTSSVPYARFDRGVLSYIRNR